MAIAALVAWPDWRKFAYLDRLVKQPAVFWDLPTVPHEAGHRKFGRQGWAKLATPTPGPLMPLKGKLEVGLNNINRCVLVVCMLKQVEAPNPDQKRASSNHQL